MWEAPIQDLCKCAGEFDLSFGEQHTEACDVGSIVYGCQEDGHMAEPDVSACFCEARDEFGRFWNQRRAGEESPAMTCMNGVSVTRTCGALTGHWEDLDASACRCEAEDEWSETGVGEWSEAPCVGGSKGMRRRQCYGYRWGEVDESRCEQPCAYNHGNGTVTKVPVGETLSVACYVNMDGAMTYECVYNEETMRSELHLKESTCTRLACTNDDGTLVNVGETESRSCGDGIHGREDAHLPAGRAVERLRHVEVSSHHLPSHHGGRKGVLCDAGQYERDGAVSRGLQRQSASVLRHPRSVGNLDRGRLCAQCVCR